MEIPERSYGRRCILENLIFESSFGGTLPPNLVLVGRVDEKLVLRSGQLKAPYVNSRGGEFEFRG